MEEESLAFVLSFLRSVGCERAQKALLKEINQKYPELRLGSTLEEADRETEEQNAGEDARNKAGAIASTSAGPNDGRGGQAGASAMDGSSSVSTKPVGAVGKSVLTPERAAALFAPSASPAWGPDVDEYETMEDVGYKRKPVSAKEKFVEQELDLTSEEGSETAAAAGAQSRKPWAAADEEPASSAAPSDDEEAPSSAPQQQQQQQSSPAQPRRVMPAPTPMPAAFASYLAAAQTAATSSPACSAAPAEDSSEWDMGPTDIKLADPVTTPRKERGTDDEPGRPVLSRVESLSSSFKDFDLDDDDQAMGRSSQPFEAELLPHDVIDVVEFSPPPAAEPDPAFSHPLDLFSRSTHSRNSSTEAVPFPLAPAPSRDDPMEKPGAKPDAHAIEFGSTLNLKPSGGGDLKEAGGGFSFPVTPSAEDTDSKLFKSWPSIRSSSMSEMAPNLDDVSASQVADYADDGYRSKLSSRTPSQKNEEARYLPGSSASTPSPKLPGSPDAGGSPLRGCSSGGVDLPAAAAPAVKPPAALHAAAQAAPLPGAGDASPCFSAASTLPDDGSGGMSVAGPSEGGREALPRGEEEAGASGRATEDGGDSRMDWQDPAGEGEAESLGDGDNGSDTEQLLPKYTVDESGAILYLYDPEYIRQKYEVFNIQVIHRRQHTGFEETKDFPIRMNDLIAGRYQVLDFLGSAAFSRAVQALDIKTNTLVCLKIVKNSKDYLDQSLDEIKLLKFVNSHDPSDAYGIVRLYDYFYYKEHLFLVCELLRANLYEFQKYNKESSGEELYFTNARIQKIAISVLRSLAFLHALDLIHSDLKPENILIKSYSRCEVKVIDLGSSCFTTDQLSSYVQSRSYRAPEVILGLPYDHKVDIWSLGCILAELSSGYVLFQNDSVATLLARLEGILGPVPRWMIDKGRYAHRFFTRSGQLYEGAPAAAAAAGAPERYELLLPKRTSLRARVPDADPGLVSFIASLLCVDPVKRPSASEAMCHPWLQHVYPSLDS